MITLYYTNVGCRRCTTIQNMLKSNGIKYKFQQERNKIKGKVYPLVRTDSGKIWDYIELHKIIANKLWDDLK